MEHRWSNQTLDFSAFQILLTRASIVEYNYTKENRPSYHHVETIDNSGLCLVDGNIFKDSIYLFGDSTSNLPNHGDISWIDIISDKNSPLIVSFDPNTIDKKPSSHASGWNIKFMQTLELMALERLSNDSPGVVIRDGGLYPICATVIDTKRSLLASLSFKNKIVLSSSKRISESTLFLELLTNPDNSSLLEFYFPDQHISTSLVKKLPADYILLPKILQPGQRTPFIEAVPRARKAICDEKPELTPVCCYYMRKREPHTIIRIEFPRGYFSRRGELEKAIRVVAWQHEIGTKVPEIQEAADRHCQLKAEANILRKITVGELTQKGLETLEVYE